MAQTVQQERAKYALQVVSGWLNRDDHSKLKARASELPYMIHTNGLGQALAFFCSKKDSKEGYDAVYSALQGWLVQAGKPLAGQHDALQAICNCDMNTYRQAQAEAIQIMDWVKKFASAKLEN